MKSYTLTLIAAVTIAAFATVKTVRADDAGVGSTPSGGLVFVKNDAIEMLSEDLTIAVNKVRVDYVFRNNSSAAIVMKIGFPLPVVPDDTSGSEFAFRFPHDQDFKVWIDGKPITAETNTRLGRLESTFGHEKWIDLTEEIDGLTKDMMDPPSQAELEKLRRLNLLCAAEDEPHELSPCWDIKKTYVWEMTFPAHADVSIRHEFKPWTGSFPDITGAMGSYCPDQGFKDAVEKTRKKERLEEANVDFVLKTAANWFGPIRSFTLRIDKEGASFVSYCPIPGLTLVRSGNGLVGTAKDFAPQSDVSIYFLGHGISRATEYFEEQQRKFPPAPRLPSAPRQ